MNYELNVRVPLNRIHNGRFVSVVNNYADMILSLCWNAKPISPRQQQAN